MALSLQRSSHNQEVRGSVPTAASSSLDKETKDTLQTSPHTAAEARSLSTHLSSLSPSLCRDVLGGRVRLEAGAFG